MEYPESLKPVLNRIVADWPVRIDCEEGWWDIIVKCDRDLAEIDPDYSVYQIKEKMGGLRYYYNPSNPIFISQMDKVVAKYERICSMTCEKTGYPGILMRRNGQHKTLHSRFLDSGWENLMDSPPAAS